MLRPFVSSHANWTVLRHISLGPAKIKWYHNTDAPLSKPEWYEYEPEQEPETFVPFNEVDNRRLEQGFLVSKDSVDVKEDHLFLVDLKKMQMSPVYWPGPVYEVRRGKWFVSGGKPLSGAMADLLDKAYEVLEPVAKQDDESKFAAEFAQSPKRAMAKLNKMAARELNSDPIDVSKETDVYDLGDGKAVVFFNETHGAIFPTSLTSFQLNVIRSFQTSLSSLLSVTVIQRGHTDDLDTSVLDSVSAAKVLSLTSIFQREMGQLFSKDSAPSETEETLGQKKVLQNVVEADFEINDSSAPEKRDVDHLVLCVHGIGQILGFKYELVNFTHSINVMRNTMRHVYQKGLKYQEIAYGESYDAKNESQKANNRIQVLPVLWRHDVSFHPRKPLDVIENESKPRLPSLRDINVNGVKPLREVVGDVVLDILLYYEPRYLKEIFRLVVSELNRVYLLFKEKNPNFTGKVHLMGHSLGSAIAFDILSFQNSGTKESEDYALSFEVENLFCVGSPVGMFKLLEQKNIRPRDSGGDATDPTDISEDIISPKCKNLYNIFHPCDPVSYRMEPLVNPEFSKYREEGIPFALQGFNTQVQNLSQLGDDFQEKISQALNWFKSENSERKSIEQQASLENALRDVISTLTNPGTEKSKKTAVKVMPQEHLQELLKLNRSGRIDYCLPMGVFSIAIVSAISAHVSYFEDEETSGFLMKEILSSGQPPEASRKVRVSV